MVKKGNYRMISFTIEPAKGHGAYYIKSSYYGKDMKIFTNNSFAYDNIDNDEDRKKKNEARKSCYKEIQKAYKEIKKIALIYRENNSKHN